MVTTVQETRVAHSGPLPSPDTLAAYDKLVPGTVERIVRMAEFEQSSRIAADAARLNADIVHRTDVLAAQRAVTRGTFISDYMGQALGFTVAIACVLGAIYAGVVQDRPGIALILLSIPTVGIVQAVRGMKPKDKAGK